MLLSLVSKRRLDKTRKWYSPLQTSYYSLRINFSINDHDKTIIVLKLAYYQLSVPNTFLEYKIIELKNDICANMYFTVILD
jgi:hypothetical protein